MTGMQPLLSKALETDRNFDFIREEYSNFIPKEKVDECFDRKFQYQLFHENWTLPEAKCLYQEFYQIEELQYLKHHLNTVKSALNDYKVEKWNQYTRRKAPGGEIPRQLKNEIDAEFVTVAWCKFFECLNAYNLVKGPKLNSLHLCEAPGAFITALNHYLYSRFDAKQVQWNWRATTLNPYYEGNPMNQMITDDRFILHTYENWLMYDDFTGDIMNTKNIEQLQKYCAEHLENEVHLITADGSIDCIEKPEEQENTVSNLHFAEILTALTILANGGAFIIKMFTQFEATSLCKMYLLNCIFEQVNVFKPVTSRPGNSEVYVICLGYKKHTHNLNEILELMKTKFDDGTNEFMPLFPKSLLPPNFIKQHEICARIFFRAQNSAIKYNVENYYAASKCNGYYTDLLRKLVCEEYYRRYNVKKIPDELKILFKKDAKIGEALNNRIHVGSYNDREISKTYTEKEKIFFLKTKVNKLDREVRTFGIIYERASTNDDRLQIKLYKCKPVDKLESSKFVAIQLLSIYHEFESLYNINLIWCKRAHRKVAILDDNDTIIAGDITNSHTTADHQIIEQIIRKVWEKKPKRLVIINYPLLTHFSVSVFQYLFKNIFNIITIKIDNVSMIIFERTDEYSEEIVKDIDNLVNILNHNSYSIHSIIDYAQLYQTDFIEAIQEYNNRLLLNSFNSLSTK